MLLKKGIQQDYYDKDRFVISTESNRYYVVNQEVAELCSMLQNSSDWDDAHHTFQQKYATSPDKDAFKAMVYETFGGKGILENDNAQPQKQKKFLRLRQQVLPKRMVKKIAQPFTFLFTRIPFWWMFATLALVNVAAIIYGNVSLPGTYLGYISGWMLPLVFASTIVHEFGHIAACRAYGAQHGGIGFGFYFIIPVNYADVHGIWRLPKSDRIIVNLAGVYFELIYISLLLMAAILLQNYLFLIVATIVVFNTARQLYPFFRLDGYWVLSDWLGIPNLITNSRKEVKRWSQRLLPFISPKDEKKQQASVQENSILLLGYGLLNGAVSILFIGMILMNFREEIMQFPTLLADMLQQMFAGSWSNINLSLGFFLVAVFYIMVIKFALKKSIVSIKKLHKA